MRGEGGENLGTEDLIGSITLCIFDGTTEGGGEEQHLSVSQHLLEVLIEIACLFLIIEDDE